MNSDEAQSKKAAVVATTASSNTARTYEECYLAFLPEARALSPEALASNRGDARLARHNVCAGVEALWPARDRMARELVTLDLGRLWALPDLARAGVYAAKLAERKPASAGELAAKTAFIGTPRMEMMRLAEALGRRGVFPEEVMRTLPKGKGRIDAAEDVLALVELYNNPNYLEALAGKHPFTAEEFGQWREAAEFLLDHLVPTGARRVRREPSAAERDVLSLWTLLDRGYDTARRAAIWLWGEAEVEHVMPKLLTRVRPGTSLREAGDDGPSDSDAKN